MSECTSLTDEELTTFAQLAKTARRPSPAVHDLLCGCPGCVDFDRSVSEAQRARGQLAELDAVGRLLSEVRRLRKRDSAWQRATKCGEPEQVHERTVRLCSCDGAILPQLGDEVDACWECDGLIKVTESDESVDAPAADGDAT